MKTKLEKISCLLLTVALCAAVFCMSAYAADSYYASDETGTQVPPASIDSITVSTENVKLPEKQDETPLTPDGNMTLIDDILQSEHFASVETTETVANKQFITVQSKNGNYFYLVIDRSGDSENVYFLNLVDEADLLALMETKETETVVPVCSCADKCVIGAINTSCEICRTAMSDCVGKEAIKEPEPTLEPEPIPDDTGKTDETPNSTNLALIGILLVILAGGGAFYWFKMRKPTAPTPAVNDLDDYEYEEETELDDTEIEENEGD